MEDPKDTNLVTIRRYAHHWEAELARANLEAEEIPAVVSGGALTNVYTLPAASSLSGVDLQVRAVDTERALEHLRHIESQQAEYEPEDRPQDNVGKRKTGYAILAGLLGLPIIVNPLSGIVLIPFFMFLLGIGFWARGLMRERGYAWASALDGLSFFMRAGLDLKYLPPAQEAEVLPGYRPNTEMLAHICKLRAHTREEE